MSNSSVRHIPWDSIPIEELNPLLSRRLITGEKGMLAHVYLKKGAVVPLHSHENEQFTYILEGALKFLIGEVQTITSKAPIRPEPSFFLYNFWVITILRDSAIWARI